MTTRALVLSGGAVKGAYQLGVLKKWMGEDDLDYEIMTGTSVGAINVAGLAQVPYGEPKNAINRLTKLWLEHVETKSIYRRWFPFGRLHALWQKSVYDSTPLIKLIHDNLDHDAILSSGRRLAVGAVCLDTGEHKFTRETDINFKDWILASASFPIFLNPIMIEGKLWSDGGIKNVTPLSQAVIMGADEIDVIVTSNVWRQGDWTSKSKRAIPDQVTRVLSLMNDKIMKDDILITGLKNEIAKFDEKYRHIKIRVVMPEKSLVSNSLEFNRDEIVAMIEKGYNDASTAVLYD